MLFRSDGDPSGDGFEEGDRAEVGFDVVVVLVAFLLRAVERLLVRILAMGDKAFVASPARLRY